MINVFPEFPPIRYQKPRIRWFTEKEIDQVFEFIDEKDRGYFLFLRYYGVRPEEASGLLRNAINWETREIIISAVYVDGRMKQRTKNSDERPLPIIPEIEKYLTNPPLPPFSKVGDSIFVFNVDGQAYTRHIRENRWNRAMRQANEKYGTRMMTLRDLRHSAATRWRRAGARIEDIQKLLGHSDSRVTTEFYADVATHDLIPIVRGK
jgi:integrase